MIDPRLLEAICSEAERAQERYGDPASTHESYGVLCEEVAELFESIRVNKIEGVRTEAIQVAAVAMRLAAACDLPAFQNRSEK